MSESKDNEPRIAENVACHAWNADRTKVALSPANNQILIYATNGKPLASGWTLESTLEEHDSFVSALDWSAVTNDIVSCSHDRNAYVWKLNAAGVWMPTLVILRINRAATSVKWSPDGRKFAVASGAKCVPVCHYEASNDWWISKMIKNHKSTVLCLDWCPNSKFIVTGGTDKRCRIFSAFIESVDSTEDGAAFQDIFPNQFSFGEVLAELDFNAAWINTVAWSPSGFRLAFAAHNSTISFVQIVNNGAPSLQTLRLAGLPLTALTFLSDDTVLAGGYECKPVLFTASGSDAAPVWAYADQLDKEKKAAVAVAASGISQARTMFQGASSRGIAIQGNSSTASDAVGLKTRHQNTITGFWRFPSTQASGAITKFSSCGTDGRVVLWDMSTIELDMAALHLN